MIVTQLAPGHTRFERDWSFVTKNQHTRAANSETLALLYIAEHDTFTVADVSAELSLSGGQTQTLLTKLLERGEVSRVKVSHKMIYSKVTQP